MPGKKTEVVVTTKDLSKNYKGLTALNDIDLKIPSGPIGLLGPNGAGKSTLIKCLLGLVNPTAGESTILGYSSKNFRTMLEGRSRVGYVPENYCLIPSMEGVSFVKYMGELSGLPPMDAMQRAHEVLDYVGIGDERYRKINTYSTGMQQKIKLAQAIVHDPELVILDEPTNGMDPQGRQEMLDLVRDIASNQNKNIILSSHLLPDVEYICEHVIILNFGNILVQGNINDLMGEHDEYEIRIKGKDKDFIQIMRKMGLKFKRKGSFFYMASKEDILLDIYRNLSDSSVQIRHATRHRQSLEDVFMTKVKGGGK